MANSETMKTVDTIIVGGGISGIGCARTLVEHGKSFLMITKNIGGRIVTSSDGKINYGAYFVLDTYRHIVPLVTTGERLHPFDLEFHSNRGGQYHLLKMLKYPVQGARLFSKLYLFKKRYEQFKIACETGSQKEVFERDPKLLSLYQQTADQYIREHNIQNIAHEFLEEGVYMCTFLPLSKVSAFDFLRLCSGLITPTYEFIFDYQRAVEDFASNIILGTVSRIERHDQTYNVVTNEGEMYQAKHVVVATEPHEAHRLLGIKHFKHDANAYVFHVQGRLKSPWSKGQYELFRSSSPTIFIRQQADGSYIFYTTTAHPNLSEYFMNYTVVQHKHWKPAFTLTGKTLIEAKQGNNLYMIGDYNVAGMEDSYITGIYAAKQIINNP